MKISIHLEMPGKHDAPETPLEQLEELVMRVDSSLYDDPKDWEKLKRIYKKLKDSPKTETVDKALHIVEPIIEKYINLDVKDGNMLDSTRARSYTTDSGL